MTESWIEAGEWGTETLPYGVVAPKRGGPARPAVAVGDHALDLAGLSAAAVIDADPQLFDRPDLNGFMAAGRDVWNAVRAQLVALVGDESKRSAVEPHLRPLADVDAVLPMAVGDYVDFYSSRHHAENLGRMFRPDSEPLLPNWLHLPVGYHGRSSTVVVSGTPIRRPSGQRRPPGGDVVFGPSTRLDIELEVGFVVGGATTEVGQPIPIADAADHLFGVALVNDWSARDIQAWEYQPLGPFLGKSFATSMAGWITPMAALESARRSNPAQDPEPLEYLRTDEPWALDLELEVWYQPAGADEAVRISSTNAEGLYWTAAQQLAHMTVNGAAARAGDLYASGTVSGPEPDARGSLIELTWNGSEPIEVGGIERTFLEDGDLIELRGRGRGADGSEIRLGSVSGRIEPAG